MIYADDRRILLTARSTEELKTKINSALDYMIDWLSVKCYFKYRKDKYSHIYPKLMWKWTFPKYIPQ